jgi:hypothetical protein
MSQSEMSCSTPRKFKLSLVGLATLIVLCPTLLSPGTVASHAEKQSSVAPFRNQNLILFKRGALDTEALIDLDTSKDDRRGMSAMGVASGKQTRIVQLPGPVKNAWIDSLQTTGAEIIGYVPNNAYIIRGDASELARVAALDAGTDWDEARPIRWMGRLPALQKLDPSFTDEMIAGASQKSVDVEIELIDSSDSRSAVDFIDRAASAVNCEPRRFRNFVVLSVTLRFGQLLEMAGLDQVLFAGPAPQFQLQDERGAQIVAGNLTGDGTQPSGPGYISWLSANGLNNQSDFVLDITDSGLDRGSTTPHHPDFFDSALHSRIVYSLNYATDGLIEDRTGHGTVVASIAAGLGSTNREDAPGYMYGLGVDPGVSLGASRIFDENGKLPPQLSFTAVVSAAYAGGARITNNSWGNSSNAYDSVTQEYDSLVRDAQPLVSGNQEMVLVFSAGNFGPGRVGSPATAKNVISVGASENYRPEGFDSCNLDGGGNIGPEGADNALDILRFSSGGPTADGRAKPDICAPGTHVYGAASTAGGFFGQGLCAGPGVYQPPDQSLYTWSSGTSFAAPHISGAASLVRRFFVSHDLLGGNRPPSPAMTKAYLINSASYMTGENAGGNLPGERQGWGLVNLSRAFDGAKRVLVDQTKLFTESGQTFEIQGSIANRLQPLRITLAWTDAPGTLVAPALVNNLDLEVTVGGDTVYRGNNLAGAFSVEGGPPDSLNNVESIYLPADAIPAGVAGNFTVTVRAANIAGDGVPGNGFNLDQDFALVIYNAAPPIDPPPPPKVPVITNVSYVKKVITIAGHDFAAGAQVEINGRMIDHAFDFDSATNSLSLRLKRAKLNVNDGDNQIVVIDHAMRSLPFILKL